MEGSLEVIVSAIENQSHSDCDINCDCCNSVGDDDRYLATTTWCDGFRALSDFALAIIECENGGLGGILKSRGILDIIAESMEYIIDNDLDFLLCDDNNSGVDMGPILEEFVGIFQRLSGFGEMYEEYWFEIPHGKLEKMMKKQRLGEYGGNDDKCEGEDQQQQQDEGDDHGDGVDVDNADGWGGVWIDMDKDDGNKMEMDVDMEGSY